MSKGVRWSIIALIGAGLAAGGGALAGHDGRHDHERARQAFAEGRIVSLRTILEAVEAEHPGELLEVELEEEHGRLVYEVRVLTPEGRIIKAYYDAQSGRPLADREREGD